MSSWHRVEIPTAIEGLQTDTQCGLSAAEVERRQERYGPNELIEGKRKQPWRIVWEQITASLVLLLLAAAAISAVVGDLTDTLAILAIVVLNAYLGFRQEYRAERAMAALKRLAIPSVKVRRDGQVREVSARDLVPGDIVLLEAGNRVPADGRLWETAALKVQESALTGESEAADKDAQVVFAEDRALGDRCNMLYRGTTVTYGRGAIVVTATGMETELGRIARSIQTVKTELTPLQRRLEDLGKALGLAAAVVAGTILVLGLLRGESLDLMLLTAISLAVAAVPEGLPAVVTISLALGAQRMLQRNALVRNLPAVETLGSVTAICSDKTGTLTENRMTVTAIELAGQPVDGLQCGDRQQLVLAASEPPALGLLLLSGALCNDAVLSSEWECPDACQAIGDPTETALVVAAAQAGLQTVDLARAFPRVAEVPFDSDRKRMTTLHQVSIAEAGELPLWDSMHLLGKPATLAVSKGALDSLLAICTRVWVDCREVPLDGEWQQRIQTRHDRMAAKGLRVLAIAVRSWEAPLTEAAPSSLERDFTWLGLVGLRDPLRPAAKEAVQTARQAGIRVVVITGDHPETARHIARELEILEDGGLLTGMELSGLSPAELEDRIESVQVFARVSPEDKLDIIRALQRRGQIVAMTGDGINDAPALKKADIGVAMGIVGTDVAKEAADVVLQDDNFATIVAAVRDGRAIYDNIRKFLKYTLTGNVGQIWLILLAPFLGMPLPLNPLQILWINLIADGMLALAIGVEPGEEGVMRRPPRNPKQNIFAGGLGRDIVAIGLLLGLVLLVFACQYPSVDLVRWQTAIFTTLAFSRIGLALTIRSDTDSLFKLGLMSNQPLLGVAVLTFGLQLGTIYLPLLQTLFETASLPLADLAIAFAVSTIPFWALELQKWMARRRSTSFC
ncbi:cation-translocating P-type ATPase [Synechococcus sp. PCC 7336]|uniref:cation-translocating P-type ATPase n=1 Tax=Synechococcus sp. PCC 7336 TaxID=195250 RepID=UPI00034981EE|nr:cation-translocating P-type ATPase [Synechococcus sp. PCC 7336]